MALALGILGLLALAGSLSASVRMRHPAYLVGLVMFPSWLTSELAPFVLASQIVVAAVLVAFGALSGTIGVVGLGAMAGSWLLLGFVIRRNGATPEVFAAAFAGVVGPEPRGLLPEERSGRLRTPSELSHLVNPLRFRPPGVETVRDIEYGPAGERNRLDVHRPSRGARTPRSPVVLQVHGGAWMIGRKDQQGQPLVGHLASRGIPSVAINYRLAPRHRFPAQLVDVKRSIAWIRANAEIHGGDPDRIIVTGGSAGGHLAMIAALTADRPELQPGFEGVDTSVVGCVPFYGPPDLRDRDRLRGRLASMEPMLKRLIMPGPPDRDPELWELGSPITLVRPDSPPFLVIHGSLDVLVYREEVRRFVDELRSVSRAPVLYAELPGAQHAFDVFRSYRCDAAVDAVHLFVELVDAGRLGAGSRPSDGPASLLGDDPAGS